jgi:beta-glucosidase
MRATPLRAAVCLRVTLLLALGGELALQAQSFASGGPPWTDASLSPDERAALVVDAMTLAEKITLLHSKVGTPFRGEPLPAGAVGSAGFVPANVRLGIPALQESDAGLGITNPADVRDDEGATALPATLALAATWSEELSFRSGVVLGAEARAKGLNVLLAGGMNLARDPRNGRNFEYFGEDPLLAGVLAAAAVRGIQSRNVISTVKHFALNGQETGRFVADARIDEASLRESDLLAFQIALERGEPGSVMCAYNLVNGEYACGNDWLLNGVLKGDWRYPGWVMSDWGAVKSVDYALHGLDQQSGEQIDDAVHFDAPLAAAVAAGRVPEARIDDMARRILRSMFAVGLFDTQTARAPPVDYAKHAAEVRAIAEQGIVVLRNERNTLPLSRDVRSIAVIGGHADLGVMSGGGSSSVTAVGPPAYTIPLASEGALATWRKITLHPAPPLAALRALLPKTFIEYDDGRYPSAAARVAARADVAIVFATQWMMEHYDAPDLTLPQGQNELVRAVAAANPNTVVVLQTGGPVLMPWLEQTAAVVAAWYPGQQGGPAIADVLFGVAEPGGRLPMTFPRSETELPRAAIPGSELREGTPFVVPHPEGSDVGYRWFARRGTAPLFPFGYGLSYTTFEYGGLAVHGNEHVQVELTATNTGRRPGWAVPQVYLAAIGERPERRLVGFGKGLLAPGETRKFTIDVDARLLADFDTEARGWRIAGGEYELALGESAERLVARARHALTPRLLPP